MKKLMVFRCPVHGIIESAKVIFNPLARCPYCKAWLTSTYVDILDIPYCVGNTQ